MVYFLKVVSLIVKIDCPEDLYLFDDWKIFFEEGWGRMLRTKECKKWDIDILLSPNNFDYDIVDNKTIFDDKLHPALFLTALSASIKGYIKEKRLKLVFLHAAGIVMQNNQACLIVGESGSGKSTLLKNLMKGRKVLGEDTVVVSMENDEPVAYLSPFNQKVSINSYYKGNPVKIGLVLTVRKEPLKWSRLNDNEGLMLMINQVKDIVNEREMARVSMKCVSYLRSKLYEISYIKGEKVKDFIVKSVGYEI